MLLGSATSEIVILCDRHLGLEQVEFSRFSLNVNECKLSGLKIKQFILIKVFIMKKLIFDLKIKVC